MKSLKMAYATRPDVAPVLSIEVKSHPANAIPLPVTIRSIQKPTLGPLPIRLYLARLSSRDRN
ncbi:MAG TPA: hypothetical protein VH255_05290 [Verrucomicrobiae bacterium]|nr:hypothetical protein [Verrucomicrobiae bacterium]